MESGSQSRAPANSENMFLCLLPTLKFRLELPEDLAQTYRGVLDRALPHLVAVVLRNVLVVVDRGTKVGQCVSALESRFSFVMGSFAELTS